MNCAFSTILFTNEAGATVIGLVKARVKEGFYPVKIGRKTVSLSDEVVEKVLNSNFDRLQGLCDAAGLERYYMVSGEKAEREMFIPASKVQKVTGGKYYCHALPVKLTGSTPPFMIVTNTKHLNFDENHNFMLIDDFLHRFGKSEFIHTDLGNGKFNRVPMESGEKYLIPKPPNDQKIMPPANVKFFRLFHNGELIYEDPEGAPDQAEPKKRKAKAEPEAEPKAEPKKRALKRPENRADYDALHTLARCAALERPRLDEEDEFAEGVKDTIREHLASHRGKYLYKELQHYLPSLDELVDTIHKNTGGTGGISMDLVESELRKFKSERECTTLERNIDGALAAVLRAEAELAFLLGQAVPFTGKGRVADAVRRVAASSASMSGTAAKINESWKRTKKPLMINGEIAVTLPLYEPRLEPLGKPVPLKRSDYVPRPLYEVPARLEPLEPEPLGKPVPKRSVADLLADFDPFSANFVE